MKGDFSRDTFDRTKHYNGVLMQQGRVQLDADWNEQADITRHRIETEASDVIGPCGVPAGSDGFKIDTVSGINDLMISPGRIYVDGIMCELEGISSPIESFLAGGNQVVVSALEPGRCELQVNQPVEIFGTDEQGLKKSRWTKIIQIDPTQRTLTLEGDISSFGNLRDPGICCKIATYANQPDYPNPIPLISELVDGSAYLVYLDVWQRHITAVEDPEIREIALGMNGPDTATRVKTIWQVKLLELDANDANCISVQDSSAWKNLLASCKCRMSASIKQFIAPENHCDT